MLDPLHFAVGFGIAFLVIVFIVIFYGGIK
jgi:hypothetical protein